MQLLNGKADNSHIIDETSRKEIGNEVYGADHVDKGRHGYGEFGLAVIRVCPRSDVVHVIVEHFQVVKDCVSQLRWRSVIVPPHTD